VVRSRPRVAFFAEIPTPYMLPTLVELSGLVDLHVVFGAAEGSRGLPWALAEPPFRHTFVDGLVLRRARTSGTDIYVDPRVMAGLARARPHVFVTGGFSAPTAFAALHGAVTGTRLVIYSVGTTLTERGIGRAQRLARRLLIPRASACVALSTDAAGRFAELGCPVERIFHAPHSTVLDRLWELADRRARGTPGRLRVLCVSRLIQRKGIDAAVEAVALAREVEPGITLDIVGTGPEEASLRERARRAPGAIRFHGFVDQAGLPELYRDADAFAFPSRYDQFGVVALEAAAAGLPLVASPYAGATTDLVVDGRSGFVVDPDDPATMADRLVRLARDPDERLALGAAARSATSSHTPAAAARGYLAAIEFALADGTRP